ncbi:fibroblast growth factor receptor-like [Sycon ciliatum]|uniref:fibroblast growth factor receptor-like n=1 Tax=Sycon ciliatum TaxID=27933 RepID=UPI0031F694F8
MERRSMATSVTTFVTSAASLFIGRPLPVPPARPPVPAPRDLRAVSLNDWRHDTAVAKAMCRRRMLARPESLDVRDLSKVHSEENSESSALLQSYAGSIPQLGHDDIIGSIPQLGHDDIIQQAEYIDHGQRSTVFRVQYRRNNQGNSEEVSMTWQTAVIKVPYGNSQCQSVFEEAHSLRLLDNANVLQVLGMCCGTLQTPPFVLLEHCSSGSLLELLLGRRQVQRQVDARYDARCQDDDAMGYASLDEVEAIPATSPNQVIPVSVMLGLAAQLAHGMEALANAQMVHGRLCAGTTLVTADMAVKIAGMRSAGCQPAGEESDSWLFRWHAMEVLNGTAEHSADSDVWSFAVVIYEIMTLGNLPYDTFGVDKDSLPSFLSSGGRLEQPKLMSHYVYSLMKECWSQAPLDRPDFHSIVDTLDRLLNAEYMEV